MTTSSHDPDTYVRPPIAGDLPPEVTVTLSREDSLVVLDALLFVTSPAKRPAAKAAFTSILRQLQARSDGAS